MTEISIKLIEGAHSPWLPRVKELWRPLSDRLGFFPDGAFTTYAQDRRILLAVKGRHLLGYALYGQTRTGARLAHLAIDPKHRGLGVGTLLLDSLKQQVVGCEYIKLSCRRDYGLSHFWQKNGFEILATRPGRSAEGTELETWVHRLQALPLLLLLSQHRDPSKTLAILDTNIVIDAYDDCQPEHLESSILINGPFADEIDLRVNDETRTELHRLEDQVLRSKILKGYATFPVTHVEPSEFQRIREVLIEQLQPSSLNDFTDVAHLAKAIAVSANVLLTRDEWLLKNSDAIYAKHSVQVLRPSDLFILRDQSSRKSAYQPARLMTSGWSVRLFNQEDLAECLEGFRDHRRQESIRDFAKVVRSLLLQVGTTRVQLYENEKKEPMALIATSSSGGEIRIPLIRISRGRLSDAIFRRLLVSCLHEIRQNPRITVVIEDASAVQSYGDQAADLGFVGDQARLTKFGLNCVVDHVEDPRVAEILREMRQQIQPPRSDDVGHSGLPSPSQVEGLLWPLKIKTTPWPVFIVPIKPAWAARLFDQRYSEEQLLDGNPFLSLSDEHVYYRSAINHGNLRAPGRILWYVSQSRGYEGCMSIRACSWLDSVMVDTAKSIFRVNHRYGIYTWAEILRTAKTAENPIMALRFSRTECFRNPVPLKQIRAGLVKHAGKTHPLVSPVEVPQSFFFDMYHSGMQA